MSRQLSRRIGLASACVLVLASATLGYRWMSTSTAVTPEEALARYHDGQRTTDAPSTDQGETAEAGTEPGIETDAPAPTQQGATQTVPNAVVPGEPAGEQPTPAAGVVMPKPGVYTWRTQGWEQAGFRRDYPPESQRIITHKDDRTFSNHHIFSNEHEEWFTLQTRDPGGVMLERRMRVVFGPVTVDRTLTFEPPIVGVPLPHQNGAKWQGTWEGPTSGSYTGETVDHRTIRIGDRDVEVYVNRLEMEFRGETQGTVITHLWFAPEFGMTVREDGNYAITGAGPGPYRTEYTITLLGTEPRS